MDGHKATEILHTLIDQISEVRSLYENETDQETRNKIRESLSALEESEEILKKAYQDQVLKNCNNL